MKYKFRKVEVELCLNMVLGETNFPLTKGTRSVSRQGHPGQNELRQPEQLQYIDLRQIY
jgi:hypothetical protein